MFSESASALNLTDLATTFGWLRSRLAVLAEPVKLSRSCSPRWSSRSPALPLTSWSAPSGRICAPMMSSTIRAVR